MSAGPWNDLFDLADEWLAALEAGLALTDAGTPETTYVNLPGSAQPYFCPQLTVTAGYSIADTLPLIPTLAPAHRSTVQGGVIMVPLTATILRCVPAFGDNDGNPPSPTEIEAASATAMADLWMMVNWTWDQHSKGLLFAPTERELAFDPAVPISSEGGYAGWNVLIRVQLDGFKSSS